MIAIAARYRHGQKSSDCYFWLGLSAAYAFIKSAG